MRFDNEDQRIGADFARSSGNNQRISLHFRLHGGESGIRTLPRSIASITCRLYVATDAKVTTLAAHPCTLLHAGKVGT